MHLQGHARGMEQLLPLVFYSSLPGKDAAVTAEQVRRARDVRRARPRHQARLLQPAGHSAPPVTGAAPTTPHSWTHVPLQASDELLQRARSAADAAGRALAGALAAAADGRQALLLTSSVHMRCALRLGLVVCDLFADTTPRLPGIPAVRALLLALECAVVAGGAYQGTTQPASTICACYPPPRARARSAFIQLADKLVLVEHCCGAALEQVWPVQGGPW